MYYSKELEHALIQANNNIESSNNPYFETACDVIRQDDMIAEKICRIKENDEKFPGLYGVEINTINACNLNCRYCFAGDGTHNKNHIMDKKTAKRTVDFLFDNLPSRKDIAITILGGEPFLNIEMFKYIVEYSVEKAKENEKQVKFYTTTNGTIFNDEIKNLIENYNINIMLSLDSNEREKHNFLRPMKNGSNSWDYIMKNSWDFYRKREKAVAHITLTPYNYHLYEYAKFCYDAGFYCVNFNIVQSSLEEYKFSDEQLNELKEECTKLAKYVINEIALGRNIICSPLMDKIRELYNRVPTISNCAVPHNQCAIGPDGKIYPCDMLMWDEYCFGDVNKGGRDTSILEPLSQQDCDECWCRYICGGLCLGRYYAKDDVNRTTYCKYQQFISELQIYTFIELSTKTDYVKRKMEVYTK